MIYGHLTKINNMNFFFFKKKKKKKHEFSYQYELVYEYDNLKIISLDTINIINKN